MEQRDSIASPPAPLDRRSSGVLLHPTSLPGPFGIGDLGPAAYRFADFLATSGQSLWQMLPMGPAGPGGSPYDSPSAFAGNPLLVSLEILAKEGYLSPEAARLPEPFADDRVDFDAVSRYKRERFREALAAFRFADAEGFRETAWVREYLSHDPDAELSLFVQYQFHRQWSVLREYCRKRGIALVGDVPIFVALESSDVLAHPELFLLDSKGKPERVASVPPDYFSKTGQLWGNPLYRWENHAADGFRWWIERFRAILDRFDAIRLDHFIGFVRSWGVPASAQTAAVGEWLPGPGAALFEAVEKELGRLPIIAEDLGLVTPAVTQLRERFGYPGMRVLQFAFGANPESAYHRPEAYPENAVAYTGTHDNDTALGWFRSADPGDRERALAYLKSDGREIHWDFIRAIFDSHARIAMVPLQDILGLGSEARMNRPATIEGNWRWRFREGALTDDIVSRLRSLTLESDRALETRQATR